MYTTDDFELRRKLSKFFNQYSIITGGFYLDNLKVYHYTSPGGLKGIIENKCLFFTDCDYLCDRKERIHFYDVLNKVINELTDKLSSTFVEHLDDVIKYCQSDVFFTTYAQSSRYRFFVFCCSVNDDNILLWNNYTKNQQKLGYNIAFEVNDFSHLLFKNGKDLLPIIPKPKSPEINGGYQVIFPMHGAVIYNDEMKSDLLKQTILGYYDIWQELNSTDHMMDYCKHELSLHFSKLSLFYKNISYRGEEEFRFIIVSKSENLMKIKDEKSTSDKYGFRLVHGINIPYIKIGFEQYPALFMGAKVSFGMSENCDLASQGLQELLFSNGLLPKVSKSDIPIRY